MKHTKTLALLLVIVMFALSGCGAGTADDDADVSLSPSQNLESGDDTSPETEPIVFTDMMDREISLEAPAERIVALTASDCEIVCALGAGDTLVGRGEYCDYPDAVLDVMSVQSGYETNIEEIIALDPDVVLMGTMNQTIEHNEALENAGITVVVSEAADIDGVYSAIEIIGMVTGKNDEAAGLVSGMKSAFDDISALSTGNGSETVYFEVSPIEWGLWTAGTGTFMNEIAAMLGLTNAFADVEGWASISQEQVIERDPDYIVTITMYYGEGPTPVEEIMSRVGWQDIAAVKNGNIFNADNDEISRPGPRLTDAARALWQFVYAQDNTEG